MDFPATVLLAPFVLEDDEKKSPKPPVELIDVFLGAGALEGGSKKEPPEPKPDDVKPARLLLLEATAGLGAGLDDACVDPKLSPLKASVIAPDGDCSCENGSAC